MKGVPGIIGKIAPITPTIPLKTATINQKIFFIHNCMLAFILKIQHNRFMAHYFENDDSLKKEFKISFELLGEKFELISSNGVFSKNELDDGTKFLIEETVKNLQGETFKFCDLGCGYGVVGVCVLKKFTNCFIDFVDINEQAVNLAKQNAKSKNANFFVQDGLNSAKEFDYIATNPPFRAGNKVLFKLFKDAFVSLKNGGKFFVVLRKKQGAETYVKKIEEIFGTTAEILKTKKGYVVASFLKEQNENN